MSVTSFSQILRHSSGVIKILDWCPAGSVLPHGEKVTLELWSATLFVIVLQQKYLWGRCFITSTKLAPPPLPIKVFKTKSYFIARSVETDYQLRLTEAVISVDAYPFFVFSDLTCLLEDTGIGVFQLHCAA